MKDHIQGFHYLYLGKVHDKPILPNLRLTRIKMLTMGNLYNNLMSTTPTTSKDGKKTADRLHESSSA